MNQPNPTLERIKNAMRSFHRGDRPQAREELRELWDELGASGDTYHRSVVAHYLADVQDNLQDELTWDLRALETAESASTEAGEAAPALGPVRAFLPSLHLNLADVFRRMGQFDRARDHVERGGELSGTLGLDAYGQTVRSGLIRVQTQIDDLDSGPAVIFEMD